MKTLTVLDLDFSPAADEAIRRCEYSLVYDRAIAPRQLKPGWLGGDRFVPNARGLGLEPMDGTWEGPKNQVPDSDDVEDWMAHFASLCIDEGVHEVLEWFGADGEPWLDPHGPAKDAISEAVTQLCARLAELRRDQVRLTRVRQP